MFKNYLLITFRNLGKNKAYLSINLLGLALGTTCALLIFVVVRYQLSYDTFHQHLDQLYRVYSYTNPADEETYNSGSTYALAEALRTDFGDLAGISQVKMGGGEVVVAVKKPGQAQEQKFLEAQVGFVDPEFFALFTFPVLVGDPGRDIKEPNTAFLTEATAAKYFGQAQAAVGQTIRWDNQLDLRITGIVKDFPRNSDFQLDILVSAATLQRLVGKDELTTWNSISSDIGTFVRLPSGYTQAQVEARFPAFRDKYYVKDNPDRLYALQPLREMHFDQRMDNFGNSPIAKPILWSLVLIGGLLVVAACINFVNLATAQATRRSKEVGVRKVLGSSRAALVRQFMGETLFITLVAVLASVAAASYLLGRVNNLLGLRIGPEFLWHPQTGVFLVVLTCLVAFLSGIYPALVLSGFNPVLAIKNGLGGQGHGGVNLRRGLVVAQFAISQILICCTVVALQQMELFRSQEMGFRRDGVLTVTLPLADTTRLQAIKNELRQVPGVDKVALAMSTPASGDNSITNTRLVGKDEKDEIYVNYKRIDEDYLGVFGLQLVAGRNLQPSDTLRELIINETCATQLGFANPADAVGKEMLRNGRPFPVVGVVKDFYVYSLHQQIGPVLMGAGRHRYQLAGLKFSTRQPQALVRAVERVWSGIYPEYVYQYRFLDDSLAEFYKQDENTAKLFQVFAAIAIFIGCIGLYGLVTFMAAQKRKEIGIRKVLGANVGQIVWLFSQEFARLLLIAFVLAVPVVYFAMNAWLADYAYRISIGGGTFLLTIAVSLAVACLTVGYQSLRAALANPVNSLRSE
jgi:predicted permease